MPALIERTPEMEDEILEWLANGKAITDWCAQDGKPSISTFMRWQAADAEFGKWCACAREIGGDAMDAKALAEANGCTVENWQAAKVKISTYQWRAAKLKPKAFGDAVQLKHTDGDGAPIVPTLNVTFGGPALPKPDGD